MQPARLRGGFDAYRPTASRPRGAGHRAALRQAPARNYFWSGTPGTGGRGATPGRREAISRFEMFPLR